MDKQGSEETQPERGGQAEGGSYEGLEGLTQSAVTLIALVHSFNEGGYPLKAQHAAQGLVAVAEMMVAEMDKYL